MSKGKKGPPQVPKSKSDSKGTFVLLVVMIATGVTLVGVKEIYQTYKNSDPVDLASAPNFVEILHGESKAARAQFALERYDNGKYESKNESPSLFHKFFGTSSKDTTYEEPDREKGNSRLSRFLRSSRKQ